MMPAAEQRSKIYSTKELNMVSAVVSVSGIIFQLMLAANMSYLLGNAVMQYSITIGLFLSGMGIGSYLSRYIEDLYLYTRFIIIQLTIALIGGSCILLLFIFYAYTSWYQPLAYLIILLIGANIGCEAPILVRMATGILRSVREGTSDILAWDYVGSLLGSLMVPFIIIPFLGYVRGAFAIGLLNWIVACFIFYRFRDKVQGGPLLQTALVASAFVLFSGIAAGDQLAFGMEQRLYRDYIIKKIETHYQKIIVTKNSDDLRLYINGNLQFSSWDEYRYHEALVHIPVNLAVRLDNVLILGGGDGLAARELLKYEEIKQITLVDLDPEMVDFCRTYPEIKKLNQGSLDNPRVKVINQDAYKFMEQDNLKYDIIIADLPDPNDESLNKLYTLEFYNLVKNHLAPGGIAAIQSTSPLFAPEVFWTIVHTVAATGLEVRPYHVDVPSLGDWGFTLAADHPVDVAKIKIETSTRYLNNEVIPGLFQFGRDEQLKPEAINTLLKPVLIPMYEKAWQNY